MQNLTVRVLSSISQASAADWGRLRGGPFTDWTFLCALEASKTVCQKTGWRPHHLVLEADGAVVAASPMYLKAHSGGEFVFDHSWASASEQLGVPYYPKGLIAAPLTPVTGPRVLVAPDLDPATAQQLLGRAAADLTRAAGLSSAHWLFVTPQEAAQLASQGYGVRLGIQYHWHNQGYQHLDHWLEAFKSKRRVSIRRERRAVADLGLIIDTITPDQIDDAWMRTAFRLYKTTIDKKIWGRQYLNEDFFIQLGRTWPAHLLLIIARKPDTREVIAGSFFIQFGQALYGRYWGCFQEIPFLHFELSYYKPIELCIANGWTLFEAGAQGEHKYERGFAPMLTYSAHVLHNPRLSQAVERFLTDERDAVTQALLEMRAQSPSRAVQNMPPP